MRKRCIFNRVGKNKPTLQDILDMNKDEFYLTKFSYTKNSVYMCSSIFIKEDWNWNFFNISLTLLTPFVLFFNQLFCELYLKNENMILFVGCFLLYGISLKPKNSVFL